MAQCKNEAVVFAVGTDEFGIHINQVLSVERTNKIRRISMMPEHVGICTLQRGTFTVIDLRKVLEVECPEEMSLTVILVKYDTKTIGLLVDEILDIYDIPPDQINSLSIVDQYDLSFVEGIMNVDDHTIMLMDVKLFLEYLSHHHELDLHHHIS